MAEDVTPNDEPSNPCCRKLQEKYAKLKEKYSKLEEGRNALRKGLSIFEQQISKMQTENLGLKKAYEDEKGRANSEKEDNAKGTTLRIALEKEVAALKSEVLSLQQNGGLVTRDLDEEIASLQGRISGNEAEINQLKELLKKERIRADVEQKNAEKEKKKADEANKKVKAEQSRANEEKRLADIERKKAEEFRRQIETLKCKVDEAMSKLALEAATCKEANNKLNAERERAAIERKRANSEMAKVEEQRKAAEANWKKAMDERSRADNLSQQLDQTSQRLKELEKEIGALQHLRRLVEFPIDQPTTQPSTGIVGLAGNVYLDEESRKFNVKEACKRLEKLERKLIRVKKQAYAERKNAEEQRQVAEAYKKAAMEEKHHSNLLSHELECYKHRSEEVQDEIQKLVSCRAMVQPSSFASGGSLKMENAETKLLKKQLKFEKRRVKHAKKAAKMEISHNQILQQEVCQLKRDLLQFSQRLDVLDNCLLRSYGDMSEMEQLGKSNLEQEYLCVEPCQKKIQYGNVFKKPNWTKSKTTGGSVPLMQRRVCPAPLAPISGDIYMRSNAGIDSESEPILRGCNRKMLQSSALNSSSASFSDRALVGSQERGDFSVSTSPKLGEGVEILEPTHSGLSSDTKKSYNEKLSRGGVENSVGSPIKYAAAEMGGNPKKKRGLPDTAEHLGCSYSLGQNGHQQVLLPFLHKQMDKDLEEERLLLANLGTGMHWKQIGPYKKRKSSTGEAVAIDNLDDSSEPNTSLGTSGIEQTDVSKHASPNAGNLTSTAHVKEDGRGDLSGIHHPLPRNFDETMDGDYMKLLDLDNDVDEERYRKAIQRPLSPALPVIELQSNKASEMGSCKSSSTKCSFEKFSNGRDNPKTYSNSDINDLDIDSNKLAHQEDKYLNTACKLSDKNESDEKNLACVGNASQLICHSGMQCSVSWSPDSVIPCESRGASTSASFPKYFVVSSDNNDNGSISRIYHATSNCVTQFSTESSSDAFTRNIVVALKKADDLSATERVCVFISVLLHHISEIMKDFDWGSIQLIDSFAQQMCTALLDVDTRKMFMELCDMYEVFALTEDFLLNRRVMVYDHVSDQLMLGCDSSAIPVVRGSCLVFSVHVASIHLLVAGGVFLASICVATDQIGVLCEVSCNIFRMLKSNSSLVLTLLHIFAHICGPKYFKIKDYGLEMSVLKSLVVFLEKLDSPTDSAACFSSVLGPSSRNSSFIKCPFLDDVASVDCTVKLLLEKLQQYAFTVAKQQDPKEASYLTSPVALSNEKGTVAISGHGNAVLLNFAPNENLYCFIDILSLLELVACLMSWDWIFGNIILHLLQMVESGIPVLLSSAIITLLGQLGRLGVDAVGYEDSGVDSLRKWLSDFLSQSTSRNFSLSIQFACVMALAGLIANSFEEVVERSFNLPAAVNQSVASDCVRQWFSSLSNEQQSSLKRLSSCGLSYRTGISGANTVAC